MCRLSNDQLEAWNTNVAPAEMQSQNCVCHVDVLGAVFVGVLLSCNDGGLCVRGGHVVWRGWARGGGFNVMCEFP